MNKDQEIENLEKQNERVLNEKNVEINRLESGKYLNAVSISFNLSRSNVSICIIRA